MEQTTLVFKIQLIQCFEISYVLKIIRPVSNPVYSIQNCIGLKLLTRLRLGLSHLNEHRFNYNFQNCINPLCTCSQEVESTAHFFLHCHHYHNIRAKLLNSLEVIDTNLLKFSTEQLTKVLLNGFCQLDQNKQQYFEFFIWLYSRIKVFWKFFL